MGRKPIPPSDHETPPPLTLSAEEREALARGHVLEELSEQITQKLILSNIGPDHARALANEFRLMLYEHVLHCPWTMHADQLRAGISRKVNAMKTTMDQWEGAVRILKWQLPILAALGAGLGGIIISLLRGG